MVVLSDSEFIVGREIYALKALDALPLREQRSTYKVVLNVA
jgi:hypothetical protein